ncbi:GerAB/ArcD/ProY family transporter [Vallitalea guaymasensis]|uniref:GerAB/ArcD/ProY family transporter n=1 Tax=Vallitalea guaymasensis TaxID=1185412 RepID=UPI002355DA67|nr:endospore germination permease [Vallitalea guaymasensis]
MDKTVMSNKQGICLIILFMSSSSLVLSSASEARRDIWIAMLLGLAIAILIVAMYSRVLSRFPDKNLYEINISVFGRIIGSIINLIFTLYSFYLGALVLKNFSLFIGVVGLESTPLIVVSSAVIIIIIYGVKEGIEVLGRWSAFFAKIVFPIIIIVTLLMLNMVDVNNLKPILGDGIGPVLDGAFSIITFPYAELVIFVLIFNSKMFKGGNNIYKTFIYGLLLGGFLISAIVIGAYLAIGPFAYESSYFPIYSAVSRINIRDVLQRIEIIIAITFMIGGFIKISACLLACCNGIVNILKLKDYKFIVTPVSLLLLVISLSTYQSMLDMVTELKNFRYVALIVQIILPLVIFIIIEIKSRLSKSK